ncbi:AAA family ATPase [Cedecea davisae]|uniref:P-loop NTPase n=1 Tax=Cedecea davisae TaxID=158484 RepID=UPI00376EB265
MRENKLIWVVDGDDLKTKHRQGGMIALKGFGYQEAHALNYVIKLLTCDDGLVQLRYEGAQDVDIMFGDGKQLYIQYKETAGTEYTFTEMRDILHGFMRDTIDACGHPANTKHLDTLQLSFLFVSTGVFVGPEMMKLIRNTSTNTLANTLSKGFTYEKNPLSTKNEYKAVAEYVLNHVQVSLDQKQEIKKDLELLAIARLALFGVPIERINDSISRIKELFIKPCSLFAYDISQCLTGLAPYHPLHNDSPFNLLPGDNQFTAKEHAAEEFRESGRGSWEVVHYGMDIIRDQSDKVYQDFKNMGKSLSLILISGASGTGKSTLIRRVAWDIHRSGQALVFEMTNPSKLIEQAWDEIARLAKLAGKPALIVIDDISNHSQIFEDLKRHTYSNIVIIATDRSANCIPKNYPASLCIHTLAAVSENEIDELANVLDRKVSPGNKIKLLSLMQSGEIFPLSLLLMGSSLTIIAKRTIQKAKQHGNKAYELFLSLCVCGTYDQSVPKSLLMRMEPSVSFWAEAKKEHLVFDEVNRRFRSGHAKLATSILECVEPDIMALKISLLKNIDARDIDERRFGLGLLQNGLEKQAPELKYFTRPLMEFSETIVEVGDYLDIVRCQKIIDAAIKMEAYDLNVICLRLQSVRTSERVRTGHDAVVYLTDTQEDVEITFAVVSRVFAKNEIFFGRSKFMRWISEHTRGREVLQQQAVVLHFEWLKLNRYPFSETLALINCITHGNAQLSNTTNTEFTEIILTILNNLDFSTKAQIELLDKICESNISRLRDERAVGCILDRVNEFLDNLKLDENTEVLRKLASLSINIGGEGDKNKMSKLLIELLPSLPPKFMRIAFFWLVKLSPGNQNSIMTAWTAIFQNADESDLPDLINNFIKALSPGFDVS